MRVIPLFPRGEMDVCCCCFLGGGVGVPSCFGFDEGGSKIREVVFRDFFFLSSILLSLLSNIMGKGREKG